IIPRVASPAARANIAARLSAPTTPVSAPDDPTAEPLVTTGDLLLTNQILYRKLEAIAGVTLTNPGDRAAPTLPVPATGAAGTSAATSDSKPAAAKADGDESKGKEAEKPDPDVNVTADAPPAPVAEPVVFTGTTIDSVLEMRVAVAKDVSGIGFATSGNGVITDLDGNELKTLSPEVGVLAEDAGGLVVDGETMPSAFWVYPEDGGYVAVGDSWFRGRMLIAQRERGLIAVNYVLLGDYLYSVVGTEMSPDWALESLKAQAVAARSYALTHNIYPASEDYFDLDNTQRFQAYKGINREASTTQVAVQATAGEFISQEGGIVESLYAASQAIVDDAHKGAGMSQLGAKDLAEQGYSYQEILAHYYPGTALGRLETDQE
ncbi:MAG: SpoIID/LytB domain-containing protein, partial [Cyanobacteria bacterium P01_D01_bin.36]